jgi:hypothetical protein
MQLFNMRVRTGDREFDVTLRNLSIIRASEIVHKIGVACAVLLHSVKRFLVPGKLVIRPLIQFRAVKSLRQKAEIAISALPLFTLRKRMQPEQTMQISGESAFCSVKCMSDRPALCVTIGALLGAKKAIADSANFAIDANLKLQKVRKRRLGEASWVRLAGMDFMTLDALDYVVEG